MVAASVAGCTAADSVHIAAGFAAVVGTAAAEEDTSVVVGTVPGQLPEVWIEEQEDDKVGKRRGAHA